MAFVPFACRNTRTTMLCRCANIEISRALFLSFFLSLSLSSRARDLRFVWEGSPVNGSLNVFFDQKLHVSVAACYRFDVRRTTMWFESRRFRRWWISQASRLTSSIARAWCFWMNGRNPGRPKELPIHASLVSAAYWTPSASVPLVVRYVLLLQQQPIVFLNKVLHRLQHVQLHTYLVCTEKLINIWWWLGCCG